MRRLVAVAVLLLWPTSLFAADSLYVRAAGTELKAAASPGGSTVAKLDIGAKCEVLEKQGNWVKVKVEVQKKSQIGFVFAPKLGKDKPDKERLGGKQVASASEADTAQALRGLSQTSENFANRSQIKPEHIAAVKQMEQKKLTPEQLAAFLREGKLGEYQQ